MRPAKVVLLDQRVVVEGHGMGARPLDPIVRGIAGYEFFEVGGRWSSGLAGSVGGQGGRGGNGGEVVILYYCRHLSVCRGLDMAGIFVLGEAGSHA